MRLILLGRGRLLADDGTPLLPSGSLIALLAYLHSAGAAVPRDQLSTLFWPGSARSKSLQGLRQSLRRIRADGRGGLVVAEGNTLALGPGLTSCDVDDFLDRIRQGDVEGALELYSGSYVQDFAPGGWELEEWLEKQRGRFAQILVTAVVDAVEEELASGRTERARGLVVPARTLFPLMDELQEAHFKLLVRSGDLAEAAGLLEEIRKGDGDLEVERLADELAAAREEARATAAANGAHANGAASGGDEGPSTAPTAATPDELAGSGDTRPMDVPSMDDHSSDHRGERETSPEGRPTPEAVPTPRRGAGVGGSREPGGRVPGVRVGGVRVPGVWVPGAGAALLIGSLALGWWWSGARQLDALARGLDDHWVIYCSAVATDGAVEQLFRMDFDGRNKHRISLNSGCASLYLDSLQAIVLREHRPDEGDRLVLLTMDPENPLPEWHTRVLTSTDSLDELHMLRYGNITPDGRTLFVTAQESPGVRKAYVVDLVADTIARVTREPGNERYPTWDPVRREVLFTSTRDGSPSIYALPWDDRDAEPVRLTESPTQDTRLSIHGDEVIFVRGWGEGPTEGDYDIWRLNRVTGQEEPLVSEPWNTYQPSRSPDGRHLCWQSDEFGHYEADIEVMDLVTGRRWSVTRAAPGRHSNCQWTPDSRAMLFQSNRDAGVTQVFFTDLRGREARNLSRLAFPAAPHLIIPKLAR